MHKLNLKHGMTNKRFYITWYSMIARCYKKYTDCYERYGGRGIKIEWKCFEDFYADMWESYSLHVSKYGENNTQIERINNNGNYTKSNCRWATRKEQARNRRNSVYLEHNGKKLLLIEWADYLSIPYHTLYARISNKWSIKKSLTTQLLK